MVLFTNLFVLILIYGFQFVLKDVFLYSSLFLRLTAVIKNRLFVLFMVYLSLFVFVFCYFYFKGLFLYLFIFTFLLLCVEFIFIL